MRDAIQGMLSMSQMIGGGSTTSGHVGSSLPGHPTSLSSPGLTTGAAGLAQPNPGGFSVLGSPDPFEPRPRPTLRLQREQMALKRKSMVEDESGEKMPTCYKDDDYSKDLLLLLLLFFSLLTKILISFGINELKNMISLIESTAHVHSTYRSYFIITASSGCWIFQ